MITTVLGVLLVIAVIFLIVHIVKPPFPLWACVLVMLVIEMLRILPLGK